MSVTNDLLSPENNFDIEYSKQENISSMPSNHYHNHYEIYYQLSGERYYFIQDRTYYVKKGDLVLINKNDLHKTTYAGAAIYERILINFREDFIYSFKENLMDIDLLSCFHNNLNILSLSLSQQNFIETLLFKILTEKTKNLLGYEAYLKISLIELLIFLNRFTEKAENHYLMYPSALHKRISEVAQYINRNYNTNLSLKSLAKEFYISFFYLSRTFKDVTGFTITEYLNSVRIKEGQKLLRETKLNITEISSKVGFESSTHFGRVFKSITQQSPLKYRKNSI